MSGEMVDGMEDLLRDERVEYLDELLLESCVDPL